MLAVLVGGVFFLAVMSLYRMLDLMQGTEPRGHGDTPVGQVDEVGHKQETSTSCFRLFHSKVPLMKHENKINELVGYY